MKEKVIITITNNISFDQRIHKVATSLSSKFDVLVIGVNTRNPQPISHVSYDHKRFNMFFQKGKLFYAEYNLKLFFFILYSKLDYLYSVDLDSILPAALLKKSKKYRLIYDAHEYFTELPEVVNRTFVQKVWKRIAQFSIPKSDLNITVNDALVDILSREYNIDFYSIRNVPRKIIEHIQITKRPKLILYQGALNVGRGLEYIILAMNKMPDFQLVIAGDGPLRAELEKQCANLNLQNVQFLGMISPHELKLLTHSAWLGVNLLEDDNLNYFYSLANKFFDYVQAELPAINMKFPVYESLNTEFQVSTLIETTDFFRLSEIILELFENSTKYNKMVLECKKASQIWNWENEEVTLLNLFSQLKLK